MSQIRSDVSEAMSTLDEERISDALIDALSQLFQPRLIVGLVLVADEPLRVQRLLADDEWQQRLAGGLDFGWMEPIFGREVPNGATLIGPSLGDTTQMASVMTTGDGRHAYVLMAGEFSDPAQTRRRFADFARESGEAFAAIMKANERAADLATIRERERLSRDLHESLSQSLWSLSMLSETATAMTDPADPLHDMISQIAELSLSSQDEMRSMLINLRTVEPVQESIAGVLESVGAEFRARNDIDVTVSIAEAEVEPEVVAAFRRIVEEALNNVSRHSDASMVVILLDVEPTLCLRVIDDGVGIEARPRDGHLGLRIMQERATEVDCAFDICSMPEMGTVVTVSRDMALNVAVPIRPIAVAMPTRRNMLAPLLAGVLCLTLAFGFFLFSRSNYAEARLATGELDELAVLEQRVAVSRAAADELSVRLRASAGLATPSDVVEAATDRELLKGETFRTMQPIAERGGIVGEQAQDLLEGLDAPAPFDHLDLLVGEVYLTDWEIAAPRRAETTRTDSLEGLFRLEEAISFGLLEVIAARRAADPDAFEPEGPTSHFLSAIADTVSREGGFFGPDPSQPFLGGYLPVRVVAVHEAEALDQVQRIVVDEGLWADDRWLRRWGVTDESPPGPLDDYVERSMVASAAFRSVADARLEVREGELVDDRGFHLVLGRLLRFGALALVVPAVFGLVRSARAARARRDGREGLRTIDPLSGARTRPSLETDIAPLLADPRYIHHALFTLDMDRFKFVNEVHGHKVGDRILDIVGSGLIAMTTHRPDVPGVVVRTDGDQFVVSFHSSEEIPVERIRRAMNRLRSTLISAADGSFVRCGFSYGVTVAEGSPDLRSLLVAAELGAYEDKARLKV